MSREWLIGLEHGARPRAELTKVLSVLDVLDLPLAVGRASSDSAGREKTDFAALMPALDLSVLTALPHGAMTSAGALLRASLATSAANEGESSEDGADEGRDDPTKRPPSNP